MDRKHARGTEESDDHTLEGWCRGGRVDGRCSYVRASITRAQAGEEGNTKDPIASGTNRNLRHTQTAILPTRASCTYTVQR